MSLAVPLVYGPVAGSAEERRPHAGMSKAAITRKRAEWFYQQRAYPRDHIPAGARVKAVKQLEQMLAAEGEVRKRQAASSVSASVAGAVNQAALPGQWTQIGPQPVASFYDGANVGGGSGRGTAIVVDPRNADVAYLGTAGGGVWKTTDGGQAWKPLTDTQPSLAVGALVLDPSNPDIVYVGTGEENFSGDTYDGAGVLKSTDGGASWTQFPGPFVNTGSRIGSLAVHPTNGQVLLAAQAFGEPFPSEGNILRSSDGGANWTPVVSGMGSAVVFDPSNGNTAYAALGNIYGDPSNGVFKSLDAGLTWTKVLGNGTGFFSSAPMGRIGLALDPSNPKTLYATIANAVGGSVGDTLGVFKTTNGGQTWVQLTTPPACCTWYTNPIIVDPLNPQVILTGSDDMSRSLDGGSTWGDINSPGPNGIVLHPDQHAFAFSADGRRLYVANDGGAWSTTDAGASSYPDWNDLNATLATVTFYPGLSIHPSEASLSFGGTQDNGSLRYSGVLSWNEVTCGDGSYTAVGPGSPATVYTNCAGTDIHKSVSNGEPGTFVAAQNGIDSNDRSGWVAPLVMDPSDASRLYFGTYRIYQTTDSASSWTAISPDLTGGGTIGAIAVAPSDSNTIYVASSDNRVNVTTDAGSGARAIWTDISAGLPNRSITRVTADPAKPTTAYVALSGFSGSLGPSAHLFETTNGGTTWTDISGNLPDIPVSQIVVDPDLTSTLYVATDIGVFYTPDGGGNWYSLVNGLPRVVVNDLVLHEASRTLRAATHGRSAWDLSLPNPLAPSPALSTSTLNFGLQDVGRTSVAQTVTLSNAGNAPLSITSIASNGDFAQSNTCTESVAPGANCAISVTFTPTAVGSRSGSLTIADDGGGGAQTVNLTGNDAGAGKDFTISVSPASVTVMPGQSATYTVTVAPQNGFDQAISLSCSGAPAGASCLISPSSLAQNGSSPSTATITLASGSTTVGGQYTLTVGGTSTVTHTASATLTVQDFSLSASPGSHSIAAGQTASYTLSVSPAAGFSHAVAFSCTGAPAGATCTVSPSSLTPRGSAASKVTVTVSTAASSAAVPPSRSVPPRIDGRIWLFLSFASLALAAVASLSLVAGRRRYPRAGRFGFGTAVLATALLAAMVMPACGGGGGGGGSGANPGTPAGSYSLTVTGSVASGSSTLTRSVMLSLKVN